MIKEPRLFYSKIETANALGVSARTIDTMVKNKEINSVMIRGRRMFDLDRIYSDLTNAPKND